jgi:hypothetical protein
MTLTQRYVPRGLQNQAGALGLWHLVSGQLTLHLPVPCMLRAYMLVWQIQGFFGGGVF